MVLAGRIGSRVATSTVASSISGKSFRVCAIYQDSLQTWLSFVTVSLVRKSRRSEPAMRGFENSVRPHKISECARWYLLCSFS
jgi:hypothetical protein